MTCLRVLLVVLGVAAASSVADAQIYTWRDANGTLVMSDTAPADAAADVRTFKVAAVDRAHPRHQAGFERLPRQLRRPDRQARPGPEPPARPGAGRRAGGVRLQPAGGVAERGDGPDAADAGDGAQLGVRAPFDPEENIRGGTTYLRQLLERFDGERGTRPGRLQRRADGGRPLRQRRCRPTGRRATTFAR